MNPFDLPGPEFLAVYAMLGILVVWSVYILKQRAEGGEPVRLPSMDPYLIAYLRGGAKEAVGLGVVTLIDRQLLAIGSGDSVAIREGVRPTHGANDLERAILDTCATAGKPQDLMRNAELQEVARRSYEPMLVQMRLLAEPGTRLRRNREAGIAVVILVAVAAIKVAIGLVRDRPVSFLVSSALLFAGLTFLVTRGRRTVLGERVLADLTTLFDALRARARELQPYSSTNELALLVAVFGFGAVPLSAFPFKRAFIPAQSPSSDGGSSSSSGSASSGCGGGGSSCGGGGGCGGCGS